MMENFINCKNKVRKGFTNDIEEQIKFFDECRLYTVEVGLTSFCDGGCSYCYAESVPENVKKIDDIKLHEIVDDISDLGARQINWGGGEPLTRSNWFEIMAYAKEKGLSNLLMTNGAPLVNKKNLENVNEIVDLAHIHIDTLSEKVFKKTHYSRLEYLEKQILGLENLLDSGFCPDNVALAITVTKPLIEDADYKETIDWAYDEKGISVILYPYRAFGLAKKTDRLSPTFDEMREVYMYRNSKDGILSGPGFGTKFYCGTKCVINYHGDVMSCSMVLPTYVGSVHKRRFKELFEENSDTLLCKELHEPKKIKGHCSKCEKNTFCWGCRAAASLIAGDHNISDPICWMRNS
ncbi:MAG: radical SAM protein [Candidatus Altiarchaeota archaeon]